MRFTPDGYYNGIPYRAAEHGVEAVINGSILKFRSVETFIQTALGSALDASAGGPLSQPHRTSQPSPFNQHLPSQPEVRRGGGAVKVLLVFVVIIGALFFLISIGANHSETTGSTSAYYDSVPRSTGSTVQRMVDVINRELGGVCLANLEGMFSTTLRLDWTSSTTKLHVAIVLGAIGKSKETLYESGIRYLKFPNDVGGYNIIDWKTGEKTSVNERARYYFP